MPSMDYSFEDVVDNKNIQLESDDILDFTDQNPFGSV